MPTRFEWNGKNFVLRSKFSLKRLFWGTENVLSLDGEPILTAKGSSFTMDDEKTITDKDNNDYHIHLNVHTKALSLGYGVRVNGELISSGIILPENGIIGYPALFIQSVAIGFFLVQLVL